ncbi:unnamed protein product [Diatraea saccharalis]|uniref:C2H2-type domain-containing protein n=1 Tax=Diatraea saccharalis TaxID=40085 RepID=A0A9P0C190_9NEOP|nr:unnamed protein product [Diatraea saccharalis]
MVGNTCQTCLSKNRRMIPLSKVRDLIQKIDLKEIIQSNGGVCWECYKIIEKFSNFKLQVKLAQESLKLKIKVDKNFSQLSVQSKTTFDYNFYFNFDPLTSEDKKNEVNIVKEENSDSDYNKFDDENELLEEKPKINSCLNVYVDSLEFNSNKANPNNFESCKTNTYDKSTEVLDNLTPKYGSDLKDSLQSKTVKRKKVKQNYKGRKKKSNVPPREYEYSHSEIRKKFTKIVFTVQEMLKHREDRRTRPNFKKIPFKCDTCLMGFTTQEKYDEHLQKKHKESIGRFICDVCKARFPHKNALQRHCPKHFIFYKCKLCKFESVELWQAYSHCKSRHRDDDVNKIHCQQCSVVVKTPEELDDHMRTQHVLYCNECGEKFKKKSTLRTHKIRIHGVKREFVCNICNKSFMTASRLETHAANHNDTLAQQLSYCSICNIQYKSVHVYRSHMRQSAAHSLDQYSCPDCNKKFSSKVYLNKHYNFYHLKKSQFKCELCNKLFISDWRLKNHKQKHHGLSRTRNHTCNVCGKKFFTLATLRGHQLTHSEQRTFMCEDCGDTFKQRPALYTHIKLVHKGVKRKK